MGDNTVSADHGSSDQVCWVVVATVEIVFHPHAILAGGKLGV
jgi:hypothetical protein